MKLLSISATLLGFHALSPQVYATKGKRAMGAKPKRRVQQDCPKGFTCPEPTGPYEYGFCKAYLDPHFLTWDGTFWDYMGACDLVLIQNNLLNLYIRTQAQISSYRNYSDISHAALQIGGDLIEFVAGGGLLVKGLDASAARPSLVDGQYEFQFEDRSFTSTYSGVTYLSYRYTILLPIEQSIKVDDWAGRLSIYITGAGTAFKESVGLCGNWAQGGYIGRDNSTVFTPDPDLNSYAEEWQVNTSLDGDLFSTPGAAQCVRAVDAGQRRNLEELDMEAQTERTRLLQDANEVCNGLNLTDGELDNCLNDVQSDPVFADGPAFTVVIDPEIDTTGGCGIDNGCTAAGGTCVIGCTTDYPAVSSCDATLCSGGARKLERTRLRRPGKSSSSSSSGSSSKGKCGNSGSKSGKSKSGQRHLSGKSKSKSKGKSSCNDGDYSDEPLPDGVEPLQPVEIDVNCSCALPPSDVIEED